MEDVKVWTLQRLVGLLRSLPLATRDTSLIKIEQGREAVPEWVHSAVELDSLLFRIRRPAHLSSGGIRLCTVNARAARTTAVCSGKLHKGAASALGA